MATVSAQKKDAIHYHELHVPAESMAAEVHAGLSRAQKSLPPKLFYDKQGSELFDVITRLPEYYPTRTEIGLLRQHAPEMAELLGSQSILLELGSGSSIKIRLLLEAVRPRIYVPMDISREHLIDAAQRIARDYPWLAVHAACVDYSRSWDIPDFGPGRYNAFFPGSSIGNFEPAAALALLRHVRRLVGQHGGLLIGVDLKKDTRILEQAYNDSRGVTAAFNLNMLAHINRRLQADFEPGNFRHRALYNSPLGRIEMHLESQSDHCVHVDGNLYHFARGETIHTESSYKYAVTEFHDLAARAGFAPVRVWTDPDCLFSVHYLTAER
ncbi:MAG: L-histidine N(alpha)-methyltransferase [Gammaproteobacteria bacterium]|jgi:dimethylhistidine N-methyltransferase